MLIESLDIKEFRGIKSCKKPLSFSNFTVLIGRNNSGKSTILDALSLLPHPNVGDYITGKTKIDNLLNLHHSKRTGFKSLLYRYAGNAQIDYKIPKTNIGLLIKEKSYEVLATESNKNSKDISDLEKNRKDISITFNCDTDRLSESTMYIPDDKEYFRLLEDKMEPIKDQIMKQNLHFTVAEQLNKSIDDEYSEIAFLDQIYVRKVFPNSSLFLDIRDLGSGAEKAVKLMALTETIKPKLLLIDDFASGYHPSLVKVLLEWLKEKTWQTIITTHNIDVLYQLTDIYPNETALIQIKKTKDDILIHQNLTVEELDDIFDSNTDPRLLIDLLKL